MGEWMELKQFTQEENLQDIRWKSKESLQKRIQWQRRHQTKKREQL
jgi:hypothetical protein